MGTLGGHVESLGLCGDMWELWGICGSYGACGSCRDTEGPVEAVGTPGTAGIRGNCGDPWAPVRAVGTHRDRWSLRGATGAAGTHSREGGNAGGWEYSGMEAGNTEGWRRGRGMRRAGPAPGTASPPQLRAMEDGETPAEPGSGGSRLLLQKPLRRLDFSLINSRSASQGLPGASRWRRWMRSCGTWWAAP